MINQRLNVLIACIYAICNTVYTGQSADANVIQKVFLFAK